MTGRATSGIDLIDERQSPVFANRERTDPATLFALEISVLGNGKKIILVWADDKERRVF